MSSSMAPIMLLLVAGAAVIAYTKRCEWFKMCDAPPAPVFTPQTKGAPTPEDMAKFMNPKTKDGKDQMAAQCCGKGGSAYPYCKEYDAAKCKEHGLPKASYASARFSRIAI